MESPNFYKAIGYICLKYFIIKISVFLSNKNIRQNIVSFMAVLILSWK